MVRDLPGAEGVHQVRHQGCGSGWQRLALGGRTPARIPRCFQNRFPLPGANSAYIFSIRTDFMYYEERFIKLHDLGLENLRPRLLRERRWFHDDVLLWADHVHVRITIVHAVSVVEIMRWLLQRLRIAC